MLVNGVWTEDWQPVQAKDGEGRFLRQTSSFRERIGAEDGKFAAEAGRYILYVAYICPWACRTLIALRLKGLEGAIRTCAVDPRLGEQGWRFSGEMGSDLDAINGAAHMHEIYTRADAAFTGRATVPVLWDTKLRTIVNNESADILQILNRDFAAFATQDIDLRPAALEDGIAQVNDMLYSGFNNGVYQAGFASTQQAYEEAVQRVFETLEWMEDRLSRAQWLVGEQLTETDIRAFVTLARFELAYFSLFKCNLEPLSAYPAVHAYLRRLLAMPAFAASYRPDHIKAGYYSIKSLNPGGIIPAGPRLKPVATT